MRRIAERRRRAPVHVRRSPGRARRLGCALVVAALGAPGAAWPTAAWAAPAVRDGVGRGALATTWSGTVGDWAIVPMGHLGTANNTFWQLLFRPAGGAWSVATPPGVATNGGITAGLGTPATVVVGVEPSQDLRYSPVASTDDDGRHWAPGALPDTLASEPDAIARGSDGTVVALTTARRGEVVGSSGSLTTWTPVATVATLAATPAGRACGLESVGAVGVTPAGVEVGGVCSRPGVVGLFVARSGGWVADGPTLSAPDASASASVLRFESAAGGTSALVELRHGARRSLLAMWRSPEHPAWSLSAPLALRGALRATGEDTAGTSPGWVVVSGAGTTLAADTIDQGGAGWAAAPAPPATTAAVVDAATGLVAIAVDGSDMTSYSLDETDGAWIRTQTLRVPIQYGSST